MRNLILAAAAIVFCVAWACNPPATTPATALPAGTVGVSYSSAVAASGQWTYTDATAVPGLALIGDLLEGVPSQQGKFEFAAQSSTTTTTQTQQQSFTICVNPAALVLPAMTVAPASVGQAYSLQFNVTGGTPPYHFSIGAGSLPPGLTLSSSGLLSGTPTAEASSASFTIVVTDSSIVNCLNGSSAPATAKLSIGL